MRMRRRTNRRLLLIASLAALVVLIGVGAFSFRRYQIAQRFQDHRDQGIAAYQQGEYPQAIEHLGKYLTRHDDDIEVYWAAAESRREVPLPDNAHLVNALGLYRRVMDMDPSRDQAVRAVMNLAHEIGYATEAIDSAQLVLQQEPNNAQAQYVVALARHRLGETREAISALQKVIDLKPDHIDAHRLNLSIASRDSNYSASLVDEYRQMAEDYPQSALFRILLGTLHHVRGNVRAAEAALSQAKAMSITDPEVALLLVQSLERTGRPYQAGLILMNELAGLDDPRLRTLRVERLWQSGRLDDVAKEVAQADLRSLETPTRLIGVWALTAFGRSDQAALNEAVAHLESRVNEPIAGAWVELIEALQLWKDQGVSRAIPRIQALADGNPSHPYFHFFLGRAFSEVGDANLALTAYRQAATRSSSWAQPCLETARLAMQLGLQDDSLRFSLLTMQRQPEQLEPVVQLAESWAMHLRQSDRGQAEQAQDGEEAGALSGDLAARFSSPQDLLSLLDMLHERVPEDARVVTLRIWVMADHLESGEAQQELQSILDGHVNLSATAWLRLARISDHFNLGLAEDCLARCRDMHGRTPEVLQAEAEHLARSGAYDQALALIDKHAGPVSQVEAIGWHVRRAHWLNRAGRKAESLAVWRDLAEAHPKQPALQRRILGSLTAWQDRELIDKTISRLQQASADQGLDWRVARARWLFSAPDRDQDQLAKAVSLLEFVTSSAPARTDARLLLARCFEAQNNVPSAISILESVISQDPDSVEPRLRLAALQQQQRDFHEAQRHLAVVIASEQATDSQRLDATQRLINHGAYRQAVASLERIAGVERLPELGPVLGRLYLMIGQPDRAQDIWLQVRDNPTPSAIRLGVELALRTGDAQEITEIRRRLRQLPDDHLIKHRLLAILESRTGNRDAAVQHLRRSLSINPADRSLWLSLIGQAVASGQEAELRNVLDQALPHFPDDPGLAVGRNRWPLIAESILIDVARPVVMQIFQGSPHRQELIASLEIVTSEATANEKASEMASLVNEARGLLALDMLAVDLYASAGLENQAIALAMQGIEAYPTSPEPAALATRVLMEAGRWTEVIAAARRWRERLSGSKYQADRFIALAQQRLGNLEEAARTIEPHADQLDNAGQVDAGLLYLFSHAQALKGDFDAARHVFNDRLEGNPKAQAAWIEIARQSIQQPEVAAQWLRDVESLITGSSERFLSRSLVQAWIELGRRFGQQAYIKKAEQLLLQQWEREPSAEMASLLGMLGEITQQPDFAVQWYEKAIVLDADHALSLNNLAMLLTRNAKTLPRAEQLAARAVAISPRVPTFLDTLATVQRKLGKHEAAVQTIARAVELQPRNYQWRLQQASILMDAQQLEQARQVVMAMAVDQRSGNPIPESLREDFERIQAQVRRNHP